MQASQESTTDCPGSATHKGLTYARLAGRALGAALLMWALLFLLRGHTSWFESIQAVYYLVFGLLLNLPFQRLNERLWTPACIALTALAAGFVFIMIVSVMFAYMALAEQGKKLGVPGLEGSLIFIALLQPPVVLFRRKPDLLN